mgnify:CR=1 FL=1
MDPKISIMIAGTYPMEDYAWMAREIELYGFDELHVADDLIMRPAWPILTLAGHHTRKIKLGPAIITPQLVNPAYHAANLVALDELTGGRAICGIGRGGFNAMVGLKQPASTIKMLREAVQVMRRLIRRDTSPFAGEYYTATSELVFDHKPVRSEIPIFIGTWGPKISQLAGEIAEGVKADCVADISYVRTLIDNMYIGAQRAGRVPDALEFTVGPLCSVSMDRNAATSMMKRFLAIYLPFLSPIKETLGLDEERIKKANDAYLTGDYKKAESFVTDDMVRAFSLTGTPDEIIPKIEALLDAGVTHLCFGPPHGPSVEEAITLLGERVLPYFRS